MWKNKHVVIAMLVAPVLSIIAWFAVDRMVGEQPHAAEPGAAYELIGKSNCRYASGICDLSNGEIQITLRAESSDGELSMTASHPVSRAMAARGNTTNGFDQERAFEPARLDSDVWWVDVGSGDNEEDRLRLAVQIDRSTYYVELPLTFIAGYGSAI
ncbi:MAG: hypothetical protein AAGL69_10505 [Pseudomonadota bacterium]